MKNQLIDTVFSFTIESIITGKETIHTMSCGNNIIQLRERVQALGLFEAEQCLMNSGEELDYTGQVLVLDPDVLKEEFWTPQSQLWYACDGFGCRPHAIGRSIRAICLGDGETAKWNRSDFVGILKDEYLPEWAAARVKELRPQQTGGMKMEGR
jgi:hypothetical protein